MTRRREESHLFFAACHPGAEDTLFAELKRLKFSRVEGRVRGAQFSGPLWEGWRAALHLASAVRVYRQLARFDAPDADALYRGAAEIPWEDLLTPSDTFSIEAHSGESALTHTGFVALKVKDALADRLREKTGARPSVDSEAPDFRLFCHLTRNRCTVSVDVAGRSLHRRGYRRQGVEAPISECLAAVAVELTGWDGLSPFLDPFCGSGTLLIEAGLRATATPPGLIDPDFAFLRHPGFEPDRWEKMLAEARAQIRHPKKLILKGWDVDPHAVRTARENAAKAGLADLVQVEAADVRDFRPKPGWGATVLSNPPYGKRLTEEGLAALFHDVGNLLRERCRGYAVHFFLPSAGLAKALQLKPEKYWPFLHGGMQVRLYRFLIR